MQWRRFLRGALKWGCTAAMVAIAAVWVGSRWWEVGSSRSAGGKTDSITFNTGGAFFWRWEGLFGTASKDEPVHFFAHRLREDARKAGAWRPVLERSLVEQSLYVPLWIPFTMTAASAGALWWWDIQRWRRRKGSCAACGYDRAGLAADTKCPECGATAAPK
jgi:hypothetical protein